jgi:hypothetical protein
MPKNRRYKSQKFALEFALASHKFSTKKDYTNSAAKAPHHLQSITGKTIAAGCQ